MSWRTNNPLAKTAEATDTHKHRPIRKHDWDVFFCFEFAVHGPSFCPGKLLHTICHISFHPLVQGICCKPCAKCCAAYTEMLKRLAASLERGN